MVNFSGKYVFDRAENMQAFVDKLSIDPSKIPQNKSSTLEIVQNGDNFQMKSVGSGGKQRDIKFSIGTSFVDPDILELRGKEVTVTPSWEGSKLVMAGSGGSCVTREIVGGQLVVTLNMEGVEGKRFFNKA